MGGIFITHIWACAARSRYLLFIGSIGLKPEIESWKVILGLQNHPLGSNYSGTVLIVCVGLSIVISKCFIFHLYLHSNLYFVMTFITNLFHTRPVIPNCGGEASVLVTGIDLFIILLGIFCFFLQ